MKKLAIALLAALLAGAPFAFAQYIPGSGGGGGGGGTNNCTNNSSPSDVLFNLGGTCAGINTFTFDDVNQAALNDTGVAPPTTVGGGRLVIDGTQGGSPTIDAGPKVVINGFTSGSFGGEPSVGYSAASGTPGAPAALNDAVVASPVLAYAYNGTNYQGPQGAVARIDVWNDTAGGTFSGTDMGTGICLATTGSGNTNLHLDAFCVDDDRGVIVGGNSFTGVPAGYGTVNDAGLYHKNLPFRLDAVTNTDVTAVTESYVNNAATGTNAGKVVKLSAGQVVTVGTGDTLDGIGICVALSGYTCGKTGNAAIAYAGQASCFFDGSVTAGHWVIISTSIAGDCSDGGASIPASVEILGTVISTHSGAGLYSVDLNPVGMTAVVVAHGGGGGGGAPATCALAGNYACRNLAASWSASQRGTNATITETAGTATPDWSAGNNQIFQLVHADCPCTVANPTNIVQGQTGVLTIQQSASGSDTITSWGGDWIFLAGSNPTLSTAGLAKDYFSYYVDTATRIIIVQVSSETPSLNLANIFTAQQTVNFNTAAAPTPPTGTGWFTNGMDSTAIRNTVSGFANPSFFTSMRADGTGASPSAVQSGDQIGGYNTYAFNGSSYIGPLASFRTYAAENQSSGHGGTKGCIATTPTASTTLADQFCVNNDGSATLSGNPLAAGILQPQGRLTLVTATPVMTSDQTAKSQIFYDCYLGKAVPYYNGTNDLGDVIPGCEVSLTMQTSGTGVTNSGGVFDIAWDPTNHNICVITNGSGGGWASDTGGSNTARGTGYSQIHNTRGYWTFQGTTTHCYNGTTDYGSAAADRRPYIGTLTTTAAGQTGVQFRAAAAAGGSNAFVGLSNGYNRVPLSSRSQDSTASWGVTSSTWAALDVGTSSGTLNRITFVDGLQQSSIRCQVTTLIFTTANAATAAVGCNLDAVTGVPTQIARGATNGVANTSFGIASDEVFSPMLGLHFAQAMQGNTGNVGTATMVGTNAGVTTDQQTTISMSY